MIQCTINARSCLMTIDPPVRRADRVDHLPLTIVWLRPWDAPREPQHESMVRLLIDKPGWHRLAELAQRAVQAIDEEQTRAADPEIDKMIRTINQRATMISDGKVFPKPPQPRRARTVRKSPPPQP